MRVKNILTLQYKRIRDWRIFCGILVFIILFQQYSSTQTVEDITVHIPPRLDRGGTQKGGEVPAPNVYTFVYYVFQKLNTWEKDGSTEGLENLDNYRCYITDDFAADLRNMHNTRTAKGETRNRKRSVRESDQKGFDPSKVYNVTANKWVVKLDLLIRERIGQTEIKNVDVRYPILVIRDDTNPSCNLWGLKLAGFNSSPNRILSSNK
jgi:integrating conjugative element protein (TIGR03746 family)